MADYDLTSLDELRPDGAIDQVLILDDAEHDTRRKLKAWADVEHSLLDGTHSITISTTPPATPSGWQLWYNPVTAELLIYRKDLLLWAAVEQSPFNYLYNTGFSRFFNPTAIPIGWSYYGSSTTGSVVPGGSGMANPQQKFGPFSLVVNTGNGDLHAYQLIGQAGSTFAPIEYWKGRTVSLGCWVWSNVANKVRVYIDAFGVTPFVVGTSEYHPGDSTWRWLVGTLKVPVDAALVNLTATLRAEAAGITAIFSAPTFVEGTWCPHVVPSGIFLKSSILHMGSIGVADTVPGGTIFYGPHGPNASLGLVATPMPYTCLISNLRFYVANSPGTGKTYTATLVANGVDLPLTCSVVDLNTFNVDNTNKVLIQPGVMVALKVVGTAGANVSVIRSSALVEEVPLATA